MKKTVKHKKRKIPKRKNKKDEEHSKIRVGAAKKVEKEKL